MGLFDFLKGRKKAYHHVYDVGDQDFQVQVLQRSYKQPIMVDFWAAWCMPCRKLGPVLERIAMEPDSGFLLAKLDTEVNRRISEQYHIRSIPSVKVFRHGQVMGEFQGLQLESRIRSFMEDIIAADPPDPHRKISQNPRKRLQQAEFHLKKGRGFKAAMMLDDFPEGPGQERALALAPLARFLWDSEDGDILTGNSTLDDLYLDAADAVQEQAFAEAVDILQLARQEGEAEDQLYTNKVLVSLQELLG